LWLFIAAIEFIVRHLGLVEFNRILTIRDDTFKTYCSLVKTEEWRPPWSQNS